MAIQIKDGEVLVRCPFRVNDRAIRDFVNNKKHWIHSHLNKQRQIQQLPQYTQEQIAELKVQAKQDVAKRAALFAPLVGVSYSRITIRHQKSRWGSCSGKGNLNFNCLLMLVPEPVRDYVVVHELCHRKQMNHSALFWAEVERILPNYKTSRKWLREHEYQIMR